MCIRDSGTLALMDILVEDQPDDFRALRVYSHFSAPHIISQQGAAKYDPLLHPSGLAPFDAGGSLAAFLLGDTAHNGKPEFRVRLLCMDAVIHKVNADPQA